NGTAGNVGLEALARIVSTDTRIIRVWNPLAATGGKEPEPLEEVKQFAPQAFRVQERAVTEADYAELAQRHAEVQKAVARLRWTGSWYTAFVTIDRRGGRPVDSAFKQQIRTYLERYRVAGYDIAINSPVFIPLDILLFVCVKPGYFRADIKEQLLRVFSSGTLPDGRPAFFHPDEFTFGQPIYLSQIYRTAMTVIGVDSVEVQRFQRWGKTPLRELEDGLLQPGPLEVIRLDNDPSFPENGKIEFELSGGL
ncbi:MAG: baseplate J/gp47 family protein, partial [Anaerolineae bacterium]|nr:baseplate J/gp47 family protein [Anaerolineae bacterium]